MAEFTSGQLADLGGVKKSTLRHYLDIGLVVPTRTTAAGYQLFDQHQLYQLYYIRFLRQLGYALPKIHELLAQTDVTAELQNLQTRVTQQIQQLQATQQTITELLDLQQKAPLNTLLFRERPERHFRRLSPEAVDQLEIRNAQSLGERGQLHQLDPVIYFKAPGQAVMTGQQTERAGDWTLPAGTYAVKQIAVAAADDISQAVTVFLQDPLLQLAQQPDLLIYENLGLSLVYSQEVIYTLEVRLR